MITDVDEAPRARRKRRQLDALLERALELFSEKGPSGLTIRELAAALDYTPGALYRYVESKDELLLRVELLALERVAAALRERIGSSAEPIRALVRAAAAYLELPATLPRESALIQFLLGDPRVLLEDGYAARAAPALAALLGEVAALIGAAAQRGDLDPGDAQERAVILWSALQGATSLGKLRRLSPRIDPGAIAFHTVAALLAGWGADAEAVARAIAEVRP